MPTYQYRCRACGHELEAQQAFHDDPLTACPECDGSLRKVFSAVGISFKGSGFYKNDARGASPGPNTSSLSSDTGSAGAGSSGSSSSTGSAGSSSGPDTSAPAKAAS